MWVLIILMLFSFLIAAIFLGAFIWAVKSGQYDDKYTPSVRMLLDDGPIRNPGGKPERKNENIK